MQLIDNEDHNESITFDLAAEETNGDISDKVYQYLINVRVIAAILANVFWNQIKILIRTRVHYDRELFNYEEYRKTGMMDNRLLKNILFMASSKGCKVLVAEYFKFQKKHQAEVQDVEIELNTSGKITHNLNLLSMHVRNIWLADQSIDIEPVLLVYFQRMATSKQSKDTLSKISKQFWKDLKHEYRELTCNLSQILCSILRLFQGQGLLMMSSQAFAPIPGSVSIDLQINQSFMQFMCMITCDHLIEEHSKFVFTLVRR